MPTNRSRLAGVLALLMILTPLTSADVSPWAGPDVVSSDGDATVVTAFRLPGNSTVMDGWLHVTNTPLATSTDSGIVWDEIDLDSGYMLGSELNSDGHLMLQDDGTRSNVSDFNVGEIQVTLNSAYKYSPGWRHVFVKAEVANLSACGGGHGTYLSHGFDDDFDQSLDAEETVETLYYCDTFANGDSVTSLTINSSGDGYAVGNLSGQPAQGDNGSGFSGSYIISSGIESITVDDGGTNYDINDTMVIQCQTPCGSGAAASIASVDSNGTILSISVDDSGSGYTPDNNIGIGFQQGSSGHGASLSEQLGSSGPIHSAAISDGGSNYTSPPTIVISDSSGSGGLITATLGAHYEYNVDVTSVAAGGDCPEAGYEVTSGLDVDGNRNLDASEIEETLYLCHQSKIWQATTFSDLNGSIYGDEQTLAHGVVPSSAHQGVVAAGTFPGSPVPAGTESYLLIPSVSVPRSEYINGYTLKFHHWYHLDSNASGGGDGAWVEYRTESQGEWGNWTYIEPEGGYPSTMSTDAPTPNGATTPVPVFASPTYSGWVESNVSLSSIGGIEDADELQFRFQIWTHPNASNERPGWFLDNIRFNNDGVYVGVWHHGCYTLTAPSCQYSSDAYGSLERTIDLSGTNSTSKIEVDMEWDLEGSSYDNACVELSLGSGWADISSSTSDTTADCSARSGPIPGNGYTAANGVSYTDQSYDFRTVSMDIPSGFQDQSSVDFRIVVDTNACCTGYGGSYPSDNMEGLTLSEIRVVDHNGNVLFIDGIDNSSTMSHSGLPDAQGSPSPDDWGFFTLLKGQQSSSRNFEDANANAPTVSDADGWSRATTMNSGSCTDDKCKFTLNRVTQNSGPPSTSSFPYAYGIGFSGNYQSYITEARLISPWYDISANGTSYLTFDHWSCSEVSWDGGAVFIKVNNGSWQHFDPGNWYTSNIYTGAGHNLAGKSAFGTDHCTGTASSGTWTSNSDMTNMVASLANYRNDSVRFKFAFGSDAIWSLAGWFIDNAGVRIANYGEMGHWLSPPIPISSASKFNLGFIDIDAEMVDGAWIRGSILESDTGNAIPGFSNLSFPISLAGIDAQANPDIRLKIHMMTDDPEVSPLLRQVYIGGDRILSAGSGYNGWDYSSGIEVIDDLLNATVISGTIVSDYTHSSRPIKSVTIKGNISSGVVVTITDAQGNSLGSTSRLGTIEFSTPQTGYGASVSLPTNGWIDVLRISSKFADPASNPSIDILNDGSSEWGFPLNDGYGHFGWQSLFSTPDNQHARSITLDLDGSNSETLFVRIPDSASVTSGLITISPDADGFEAPVFLSVAGSSVTGGSGNSPFLSQLSQGQISGIGLMSASHTDSDTGRQWLEVPIEVSSGSAQTVSLTSMGIGYLIFENVSGLGPSIASYHETHTSDDPPPEELAIPLSVTSDYGSITIDGSVIYDYMIVNRDFSVPNTLYPDGEMIEIVTSHHHLYGNANIADISLTGTASDGNSLSFHVQNTADGLWGSGILFSQSSGSELAPLDEGMSFIEESTHSDGYTDIVVHWFFEVGWNWDDVDTIFWQARAYDDTGETFRTASARSGESGKNAIENDLQIDSFTVRDQQGRLISNIYDTVFYPFHILEGGELNISGTVRFQDSTDTRPGASDYSVALNLSSSVYFLQSGDDGTFSGVVTSPSGISDMLLSPIMISVGPQGASGAQDVTGMPPSIEVAVDTSPPVAGPLEVNTPVGLQNVDGMVVDPTTPFSPYITISEYEARGELLTLRYWRTGVDDSNDDDIPDEEEYQSQDMILSAGLTGQQQVHFSGIDVSALNNEPIYLYIEGTDWAGLSFQDGGTGGGFGAQNAWARVEVAVDEPTEFAGIGIGTGSGANSAFDLDRLTQDSIDYYLVPGKIHTFSVRIDEPNGFHTIDNITVMLCGYGENLGMLSYAPYSETLWSPDDSMLTPISAQTEQVAGSVTELQLGFILSWDFPFTVDDYDCKPRVTVEDNLVSIESDVLSSLAWRLDNQLSAVPESAEDLTSPIVETIGTSLYLGQGDEFSFTGAVYHVGSGLRLDEVPSDLTVQIAMVYGTENRVSYAEVQSNGSFTASMLLPERPPLNPTMTLTTSLLNTPGESTSVDNSDASLTVDTASPTALFNVAEYPDSSLTIIETHEIDDIPVTVTILEEIGMIDGPLQVSWEFQRGGQLIAGTESTGELSWISSSDGKHVYRSQMDFSPNVEMQFENGDRIAFWITSTDKAGNPVIGLGGPDSPRMPTLRVVEFLGQYTREVVTPTKTPYVGEVLTIVTYWENPGKLDGAIEVGLYEQTTDGGWQPTRSTMLYGDVEIYLPPESSSIKAQFEYETWQEGQPLLVLVVNGDFENANYVNVEITGIIVESTATVDQGGSIGSFWIIGGLLLIISLMALAFYIIQSRGEDYYYDDEDWDYGDEGDDESEQT